MALWSVIEGIEEEGVLIWKHPSTNFVTGSTLIVRETQVAMFFYQGKLAETFIPGKYKLDTGTLPIIGKLQTLPTSGDSPFVAEVYFISNRMALDMKWGTTSQAIVMDKTFGMPFHLGASGTMGIHIVEPYLVFRKIVGTGNELRVETIQQYFRENITMTVKEYLAQEFAKPEINCLVLDQNLYRFSMEIQERLNKQHSEFGLEVYNFIISTINLPEDETAIILRGQQDIQRANYENRIREIYALGDANLRGINAKSEAEAKVISAGAEAESRRLQGYTWQDEQRAQQALAYANNSNVVSNPASMLAQAPMALSFGNMLNNNIDPILSTPFSDGGMSQFQTDSFFATSGNGGTFAGFSMQPVEESNNIQSYCPRCGKRLMEGAMFCSFCGTQL